MSKSETKQKTRVWSPSLFIYDAGACTKEEHDPAQAVLYHRPRNTSLDSRTAISGQLAGITQFCGSLFTPPTYIKTKHSHISMKHYGRFILMVCGTSREWSDLKLSIISRLLDSASGGISVLWIENSDRKVFLEKLGSLMDAILFHGLPDVNFEDGIFSSCSSSPSLSSAYSSSSDILDETIETKAPEEQSIGGAIWRRMMSQDASESSKNKVKSPSTENIPLQATLPLNEQSVLSILHRELSAVPFVPLPKSGASSFLRAQQLMQSCEQFEGVLAGSTSFKNRVLNSQLDLEMQLLLSSFQDIENEESGILTKEKYPYQLPKDVYIYNLNIPQRALKKIYKSIPKLWSKHGERKGLHKEIPQSNLSSLRSALRNQSSLHSYPTSIPPMISKYCDKNVPISESSDESPYKSGAIDPLMLCAKISKNIELATDGRPSRSLPGSPRKIRVATMLPDVGSDSPDLRYKVLTARRQKPGTSTNNTPRRIQNMRNKVMDSGNGVLQRGSNLMAPSLKRKEFLMNVNNGILDQSSQMDKENIESFQFIGGALNNDLNVKNTKNKLNLHFAPDKVNRPTSNDYNNQEDKISREINGNLPKDKSNTFKSYLIDDDEEPQSEESDISVLELSSYAETKENGNKLFAEATRMDSPTDQSTAESNGDFNQESKWIEYDQVGNFTNATNNVEDRRAKVSLYIQKLANMTLHLILDSKAAKDQSLIYNLYRLASNMLAEIEKSVVKTIEISEEKEGDTFLIKSHSSLFSIDPAALSINSVVTAHHDFSKYPQISEITFRDEATVLWSHRKCKTETYYQCQGACRPGLPIPSDAIARIPHRARRRLERDHAITIL